MLHEKSSVCHPDLCKTIDPKQRHPREQRKPVFGAPIDFGYILPLPYHARQAFSRTMGWFTWQPKAERNSGMFTTTPFTLQRPGECGSSMARMRAAWSVRFWHQTCAQPRKMRCWGVKPSAVPVDPGTA